MKRARQAPAGTVIVDESLRGAYQIQGDGSWRRMSKEESQPYIDKAIAAAAEKKAAAKALNDANVSDMRTKIAEMAEGT